MSSNVQAFSLFKLFIIAFLLHTPDTAAHPFSGLFHGDTTSIVARDATYTHIGCYEEARQWTRALADKSVTASGMTVQQCQGTCLGYQLFGLQNRNECYCANAWAYGAPPIAPASECKYQCGSSTCGGDWRLDVWKLQAVASSWSAAGCYSDSISSRTLKVSLPVDSGLTVERCQAACANSGYNYAGVEFSSECFCGNTLYGSLASDGNTQCKMACAGNSAQICGGPNRLTLYRQSVASTASTSWAAAGCYSDSVSSRTLQVFTPVAGGMTVERCQSACQSANYKYAGVEYSSECYCGNALLGSPARDGNAQCNMPCAGNSAQICGGPNRLTLYSQSSSVSWTAQGCYADSTTARILGVPAQVAGGATKTTIELCQSACYSLGLSIAGVEYGSECFCDSILRNNAALASDGGKGCSMQCTGNSAQTCGGPSRINIFTAAGIIVSPTSSSASTSTAPTPAVVVGARKRGLAYNTASLTPQFSSPNTPNSQVSWGYNWDSVAYSGFPKTLNYVPMLWSNHNEHTSRWFANAATSISTGSTHALGFNEPDLNTQANMTPKAAAEAWMVWMQPLAGKVKLGAPAITNGGSPMGLAWLSQFLGNCTACTIDFVPFHWYDAAWNTGYFKWYMGQMRAVTKKPLWITEFNGSGSQAEQVAFLKTVMPWLDSLSYVERYAWFGVFEGMLISNGGMSETGKTFAGYTTSTVDSFWS